MNRAPAHRRLPEGGCIDRSRPVRFSFNGRQMSGYAGDTLAAALLANGVDVIARSFKYRRPRGFFGSGLEDPSAMLAVRDAYGYDAAIRAAQVSLAEGMAVHAGTGWPSTSFDVGGLIRPFARFIKAGFYYKTFMWPNWRWFEPLIRRATGFGHIDATAAVRPAERVHASCDVLIIGGGAAGMAAAHALIASGHAVVLADDRPRLGGALAWTDADIDGRTADAWRDDRAAAITGADNIHLLSSTVVTGAYEGNVFTLLQSIHADDGVELQRHWKIRAGKVVLATGSVERPLVFPGNDRPGVMLASAMSRYIREFAVIPATRICVFTNNDAGYDTALVASWAGIEVAAVIDVRDTTSERLQSALEAQGIPQVTASEITNTHGSTRLSGITVRARSGGAERRIDCDGLALAGGVSPLVHLAAHRGSKPVYDSGVAAFVPGAWPDNWYGAGDVQTPMTPDQACASGIAAASAVLGKKQDAVDAVTNPFNIEAYWRPPTGDAGSMFVDLQNDVTVADIELASREGYVSVEHLKRYTTLGMGTDQGRTSNINGLAIMAGLGGRDITEVGTTTFRPPYSAVPMGAVAANRTGALYRAARHLPAHDRHQRAGAVFEDVGWLRPDWYRQNGTGREAAVHREMTAVRHAVGLFDGSPLGKIEVAGPDARAFLDLFYVSNIMTLKPGRIRYSLMLHEDGVIFDDGVVTCIDDNLFVVGCSSGNADTVAAWLERWRQTEWPSMRVAVAPVTSNWASIAVAGPRARDVLAALNPDVDISGTAFPHMSFREGAIGGMMARVSRISFTGELQYEINVPATQGDALLEQLIEIAMPMGGCLVGLEAWLRLRLEKGYLHVGADSNGRTTPLDLGMGGIIDKKPGDFIGRRSLSLAYAVSADREQLVGIKCTAAPLRAGGRILAGDDTRPPCRSEGYVTSACFSPSLGFHVGLALLENGSERMGETLRIYDGGDVIKAEVCRPGLYDPDNERLMA